MNDFSSFVKLLLIRISLFCFIPQRRSCSVRALKLRHLAQEGLPRPAQGGRGQCSARPQSSVIVSKYFVNGHILCSIMSTVM